MCYSKVPEHFRPREAARGDSEPTLKIGCHLGCQCSPGNCAAWGRPRGRLPPFPVAALEVTFGPPTFRMCSRTATKESKTVYMHHTLAYGSVLTTELMRLTKAFMRKHSDRIFMEMCQECRGSPLPAPFGNLWLSPCVELRLFLKQVAPQRKRWLTQQAGTTRTDGRFPIFRIGRTRGTR